MGAAAGGIFGAIGSLWSEPTRRPASVALLSAAFGAEALYLLSAHEPNARPVALPMEIAAFLMLPLVSLEKASERMRSYGWSLALAPPGAAAIAAAVGIARRVY